MRVPSEQQAMRQIAARLTELLDVDRNEIKIQIETKLRANQRASYPDGIVEAGPFTFLVEWKGTGAAGPVATAIEQVHRYEKEFNGNIIPLVAVPFMGEVGRKRCTEAKVAWLDLSGNARIIAPGIHILIEGKPNRYIQRGRPSTAFGPKSSRIVRWLLMHPTELITQREIAGATKTDEGYTSKVVRKLETDGLIVRDETRAIRARDPDLLLDTWREAYDFSKHHVIKGHIAARSGDTLLQQLTDNLNQVSVPYATTGLAAAWLLDRFALFRLVTVYLEAEPLSDLQSSLSFREEDRGANVWLVVPNDVGVFHGATTIKGVRCVHPVQAYLDLYAHPERAEEAADKLRTNHLNWKSNG